MSGLREAAQRILDHVGDYYEDDRDKRSVGCDQCCDTSLTVGDLRALRAALERERGAHPEDFCQRCGRPNVVWFAPNDVWNRAVPEGGILCPVCFVQAAERAGVKQSAWCVSPEPVSLYDEMRRLKVALAAAVSALKAGEMWHYGGCAACAEIEAALVGAPPPTSSPTPAQAALAAELAKPVPFPELPLLGSNQDSPDPEGV